MRNRVARSCVLVIAFACGAIILSTASLADQPCTGEWAYAENEPCTLNSITACDIKGVVYNDNGVPVGCTPTFRIAFVYTNSFGCKIVNIDPKEGDTGSMCVTQTTVSGGMIIPVLADCEDRITCALVANPDGTWKCSAAAGTASTTKAQLYTTIPCYFTQEEQ